MTFTCQSTICFIRSWNFRCVDWNRLLRPKVTSANSRGYKRSLPKRRQLDECTYLTDQAEAIKNFSDLDWVLDKLNNASVLQVRTHWVVRKSADYDYSDS